MHVLALTSVVVGILGTILLALHTFLGWPRSYVIGRQGSPYLTRWDLLGFSSWFPLRLFLHRFHRSDSDAALHDHPWWFVSIILRGGYYERTDRGTRWHGAWSVLPRPAFHCPRGWIHWKVVVDREEAGLRGCE